MSTPESERPRHLVVAHRTADSPELLERLRALAQDDAEFVLLVPATPATYLEEFTEGRVRPATAIAAERAFRIRARMLEHGLNIAAARVGDWDPVEAVAEELRTTRYTSIVLSTLPRGISRWLRLDVPARLARRFPDVAVVHVVAGSPAAMATEEPPSAPEPVEPSRPGAIRLSLDPEERAFLERVLTSYLGDLRFELRATDTRQVRVELRREEELLHRLIAGLHADPPPERPRTEKSPDRVPSGLGKTSLRITTPQARPPSSAAAPATRDPEGRGRRPRRGRQ